MIPREGDPRRARFPGRRPRFPAASGPAADTSLRIHTPLGWIELRASPAGLTALHFQERALGRADRTGSLGSGPGLAHGHLGAAAELLEAYFGGGRVDWTSLPIDPGPAPAYHHKVWKALCNIPAGGVRSYGQLSREVGEGSPRALGQAVGANPLPIVLPCHRVIRHDGALGGYGGGLHRKAFLLRLEGVEVEGESPDSRVIPGGLRLPLF